MKKLVGIVGGSIGHDPFNRRTWSGISYFFFNELGRQGGLHRVFGVRVPAPWRYFYLAKNYAPNRRRWRKRFYSDPAFREALTGEIGRQLRSDDLAHTVMQIGASYDAPGILKGRARSVTYSDGNLAETIQSPYWSGELNSKEIDRALAYERRVYYGADRVFAMSEYLRQSFIKDYDVPPERVVNVGGGINLEAIPEPATGKRYDGHEALFIGVEFARKGGWHLLQAFRRVRDRLPDARLHLVGPRELSIPPDLEQGVEFHGFISRNEPDGRARFADLFRRCCLFVMPSLYEPFGIAPLEAMANQVPCLVTNGWALREAVVPGETGDLVEPGDVDDLAAKMTSLMSDGNSLRKMGEAGRNMVLDRFTWERVVQRVISALPG